MHLVERFVATVTYVISFLSFSGVQDLNSQPQTPLIDSSVGLHHALPAAGPIFKPPTGRPDNLPGGDLRCNYTAVGAAWVECSTPDNRGCWLRNTVTKEELNIYSDYEDPKKLPKGVDRYYTLNLADGWINADGQNFTEAKFFWDPSQPTSRDPDNRYPGPWVQACWGDVSDRAITHTAPHLTLSRR